MHLDLTDVSTKFQLDWSAKNKIIVFSLFGVFVFQLFKMLGNTGMVAKATKFLCLEDVSWPNWCLYQVSTWLVSKEQNYCRVFVFSLFRVFVFWVLGLRSLFSESSFSERPIVSLCVNYLLKITSKIKHRPVDLCYTSGIYRRSGMSLYWLTLSFSVVKQFNWPELILPIQTMHKTQA